MELSDARATLANQLSRNVEATVDTKVQQLTHLLHACDERVVKVLAVGKRAAGSLLVGTQVDSCVNALGSEKSRR